MDEHGLYLKGKDPTGGSHLDGKKGISCTFWT